MRRALLTLVVALALATGVARPHAQGVRVVDAVVAGVERDETAHGYSGSETTRGESSGRTWRQASGSFSYTLKTYDDSPLTVVCIVAAGDGTPEAFSILVDGRVAADVVRAGEPGGSPTEFLARPAFAHTQGKTTVVVSIAARPGARTARVLEVRTVQEHLE